ncbi:CubicO group peptidase (beta-lactamase class C family) [Agrobacterium larrymoorei]|uniref:CubicO group peptidase (Beta-lactamase class C family) n=1 Tax=Agrobacterium larrymoorei TaxID=160699 RepID=A0AAJ2B754_9HYPH|nr:serine hydrolase [Agrobacterium larrymoorei]MDR6100544.1 CubicO group peptidase (beta-lactamase class C family) [Agrobacterium larrymoorei]
MSVSAPLEHQHVTIGREFPAQEWANVTSPKEYGLSAEVRGKVDAMLDGLSTTSFMAVAGGKALYTYGDVSEVSYLASTRKSILSMLVGKAVAEGKIDLDLTMADLNIDEDHGLLPIEKTATLRDLLISSSGVYHQPGSPGSNTKNIPERGSKKPGDYFHYNNWDFNVLGAAFEQLTGRSVFNAFEEDFAGPMGLQDFDPSRQRMMGYDGASRYLAYHFFLSGRDMARLGLSMVRNGRWGNEQIIPADWVSESTRIRVPADKMNESEKSRIAGYSYLWWIPVVTRDAPEWEGAFVAAGHFGQFILGMPALDMVFVNRRAIPDELAIARNEGSFKEELPAVTMEQFLSVADHFIAAKLGVR